MTSGPPSAASHSRHSQFRGSVLMDERRRSIRRRIHPALLAVFVAALGTGQAHPASATAPTKGVNVTSTYTVIPAPTQVTLCPGQSAQVAVRLARQVTRTRNGRTTTGGPSDVPRARLTAASGSPSIADVSPTTARATRLQLAAGGNGPVRLGAWFTVTAHQPGQTSISFRSPGFLNPGAVTPGTGGADDDLTALATTPTAQTAVKVECRFKVTLSGAWNITGQDVTHYASFVLADVGLAPDQAGRFVVNATMPNRVIRAAAACGGMDTVSASSAQFAGSVSPNGFLDVTVDFGPYTSSGSEGCTGKARTGSGTIEPLSFHADVSTGQRSFFFNLPHVLHDDSGTFTGQTYVYLTVLP
ncbi:MAG TPA: hypothetical protein VFH98_04285 [Candidatus Limnocylindria bacterium]|nr:hypothetical protein [Candidatus Limnocylindria bacterium]